MNNSLKITKRFTTMIVVMSMVLSAGIGAAAARFTDVKTSDYFYEPVEWAVKNGITAGTSDTTFSPDSPCTRGQVMTFLWRAMGSPADGELPSMFDDVSRSDFLFIPVSWAVKNGVTGGVSSRKFAPNETCTRGQVMTFLWRAMGSPEPRTTRNQFDDVKASDYFYKPVLWAVENGVTAGTGKNTFGPDVYCTRAQVMTFLWHVKGDVSSATNWKEGYALYLETIEGAEKCKYDLIYVDSDDVPELIIHDSWDNKKEALFDYDYYLVAAYASDVPTLSHVTWYNTDAKDLEYIEKENNMLVHFEDNFILDTSLRLVNRRWVAKDYGYRSNENRTTNPRYNWDGQDVSKEQYYAERAKVYDSSRSKTIDAQMSYQELMGKLR